MHLQHAIVPKRDDTLVSRSGNICFYIIHYSESIEYTESVHKLILDLYIAYSNRKYTALQVEQSY